MWPDECPLLRQPGSSDAEHAASLINAGAEHTTPTRQHFGQAALCWNAALALVSRAVNGSGDGSITGEMQATYLDVAEGNARTVQARQLAPYSVPPQALAHDVRQSFWVAAGDVLVLPQQEPTRAGVQIGPDGSILHRR